MVVPKDDNAREVLIQAEALGKISNKEAINKAKEAYSRALDEGDNLTRLKALVIMGRCVHAREDFRGNQVAARMHIHG